MTRLQCVSLFLIFVVAEFKQMKYCMGVNVCPVRYFTDDGEPRSDVIDYVAGRMVRHNAQWGAPVSWRLRLLRHLPCPTPPQLVHPWECY